MRFSIEPCKIKIELSIIASRGKIDMHIEFTNNQVTIDETQIPIGQETVFLLNYNYENLIQATEEIKKACFEICTAQIPQDDRLGKIHEIELLIQKLKKMLSVSPVYRYTKDNLISPYITRRIDTIIQHAPINHDNLPKSIEQQYKQFRIDLQEAVSYGTNLKLSSENCKSFLAALKEQNYSLANANASIMKSIGAAVGAPRQQGASLSITYRVAPQGNGFNVVESYDTKYSEAFVQIDLFKALQAGRSIQPCKNCGKYFVATSGHNLEYCNEIPDGETRPCSEIGPIRAYAAKVKGDPLLSLYNRAYKTHYARRKKNKMTNTEFSNWCSKAKSKLQQVREGTISIEDFSNWLKI